MSIRAVIFGFNDTIRNSRTGEIYDGIKELWQILKRRNIKIAIVANEPPKEEILSFCKKKLHIFPDLVVTRKEIDVRKPSPKFVYHIIDKFKLSKTEVMYLGAHGKTDLYCAHNANVLYIHAGWSGSNPSVPVFRVDAPLHVFKIIDLFFNVPSKWTWELEGEDTIGRPIKVRAMIPYIRITRGNYDINYPSNRVNKLANFALKIKDGNEQAISFFNLFLIGFLYSTSLYLYKPLVIYPSSTPGKSNKVIGDYVLSYIRFLHNHSVMELSSKILVRHTPAIKSSFNRSIVDFNNQASTVGIPEEYLSKVSGKKILVIDDFTTRGYSFECARNLLLGAGAKEVVCIAIGLSSPTMSYKYTPYISEVGLRRIKENLFLCIKDPKRDEVQITAQFNPESLDKIYTVYEELFEA